MSLLIRGGRVVDPSQNLDEQTDLLIKDGRIARIGRMDGGNPGEIFEASGLIVTPGLIDMHVHLREPGREDKETIETGCLAAAAGGFTSIACMPNTQPVNDNPAITRFILDKAREACGVNVFPIGAVTRDQAGRELAEVGEMVRAGAVAISDDGHPVDNPQIMRRALEYARTFDIPIIDHCENRALAAGGCINEGRTATRLGLPGLSRAAEEVDVIRDIVLSRITEARVHIAHLSTKESLDWIRQAKERGIAITCEVTPHHFTLTDENVGDYDTNFKMNPPLREAADVQALLEGLADGSIDCVATDHAPHTALDKDTTFEAAANGIVGLETAIGLAWETLVRSEILSVSRLVELCSLNPSRVLNLDRGTLRTGSVADVTIIDPDFEVVVDPTSFRSKGRNTPYAGWKLHGVAAATIVAGKVVFRRGNPGT